jgi:purine-binding chemotaxis protein CheW
LRTSCRSRAAEVGAEPEAAAAGHRLLLVEIAGERLGLPAGSAAEIIRARALARVPQAPASLLGVINLRGAVVPVLSLARLTGRAVREPTPATRIVVLAQVPPLALLVDAVAGLGDPLSADPIDLPALLREVTAASARSASTGRASAAAGPASADADKAENHAGLALLGFTVAGQLFGLALEKIVEVLPLPEFIALPDAEGAALGVADQDGALLPLVAARRLLGRGEPGAAAGGVVVITRLGAARVGLVVDAVEAVVRTPETEVERVPVLLARGSGQARVEAICRLDGGRRLLSVLSPDALFDDETVRRVMAAAPAGEESMTETAGEQDGTERFVIFELAEEHYGLPIGAVDQIVRLPDVLTRVPRAPPLVEGVMNLRGAVVPVIDAGRRFGASGGGAVGRRRVIVVTIDGLKAGLIVDRVSSVLAIRTDALLPAPPLVEGEAGTFDRVIPVEQDDRLILLISPKALLEKAEHDMLAALAAEAQPAP